MSRFFDALNKETEDLNGVELPFNHDELNGVRPAAAASSEPPRQEPRSTPQPEYRRVSIRVPAGAPVLPFDSVNSDAAERYSIIRTRIVQHISSPRVICVSSTSAGDGKTVNALNIASSLALKKETTVLLVDGDLRRPQLASLLDLPESPGMAEYLAGNCAIEQALVCITEMPHLYFLPSGHCPRNPAELLDSNRWRSLMEALRRQFDFIVIDCPPMGVVTDYDLILAVADGVILVARPGHSNRNLLYKGLEQVPEDKLLGVVVNCAKDWFLHRTEPLYYRYVNGAAGQK
jgi:capsular exopolysaccharide synthesis family protein